MTSIAWLVAGGLLTGAMYFTASKASSGKNTWSDRDVVSFVPLVLIWIISTIWHGISTHSWAMLFAQILTLLGTLVVLTTVSKGVLEKLYCHLQGLKYSDQAVLSTRTSTDCSPGTTPPGHKSTRWLPSPFRILNSESSS